MPEQATTPTVKSKTFIAVVVSVLTGLPVLVQQVELLDLGLSPKVRGLLALISVVAAWLAPILARHAAVEAVQRVEAVAETAQAAAETVNERVAAVEVATGTGTGA